MLFNGEQLHRGDILLTNNEETCCDKVGIVSNYEWCLKIYVRSFLKVQYKVTIGPFLPFIVIEIMSMVSACRYQGFLVYIAYILKKYMKKFWLLSIENYFKGFHFNFIFIMWNKLVLKI